MEGTIIRALSGFYDVACGEDRVIRCRARGKFRLDGTSPLVGDRVRLDAVSEQTGVVAQLLPRKNFFIRPAIANLDLLVILCANVNPVTDPFLIDRVAAIAANGGCEVLVCINKADLDPGDRLYEIYSLSGCRVLRTSAATGQGLEELRRMISGKTSAFTGNSGVGKSSVLNALAPELQIPVGEVSEKLGRGRHTTRHVELYRLDDSSFIADTPGFASFDVERMPGMYKERLQDCFPEFRPYLGQCRFQDCAHLQEPGCAVLEAVAQGKIHPSRHESYARLYAALAKIPDWERKKEK